MRLAVVAACLTVSLAQASAFGSTCASSATSRSDRERLILTLGVMSTPAFAGVESAPPTSAFPKPPARPCTRCSQAPERESGAPEREPQRPRMLDAWLALDEPTTAGVGSAPADAPALVFPITRPQLPLRPPR